MATGFYLHPDSPLHDTGWGHPEHQGRLRTLASTVGKDLLVLHDRVLQMGSPLAATEDLLRVHTPGHVERVRRAWEAARAMETALPQDDPLALGDGLGPDMPPRGAGKALVSLDSDTVVSPHSWNASLGSAGGLVDACLKVARGELDNAFVASRPPGHHATPDRAMGFCLFNTVAVAARALQAAGLAERILILDWDVHHGNGTQDAFYQDPSVFFLSLHQSPWYPGTGAADERGDGAGEGTTLNVPLAAGTSREAYRIAFNRALNHALEGFAPDFILISAGYDAMAGDPLGGLLLEPEDFYWMTGRLMESAAARAHHRVVATLEGGYDPKRTALGALATIRALAGVELDMEPSPF